MLAEMGEHQLMIRDYLRHSDLHVTNKYLQATTESKSVAQAPGCHPARWRVVGKQINPSHNLRSWFSRLSDGRKGDSADAETFVGPKRTQINFRGSL